MAKQNDSILLTQQEDPVKNVVFWRHFILVVLCLGVLGGIGAAVHFICRKMYVENPQLTLRRITTTNTVNYPYPKIIQKLSEMGIETGQVTLPRLSLEKIRLAFENEPLVEEARITLKFPDTMKISVMERIPVAILRSSPSFCIDKEGVILPREIHGVTKFLPQMVGIRTPDKLVLGEKTNDHNILTAVYFLKQTHLRPEGINYDVNLIQIDNSYRQLRVILNARSVFRQGASLILPMENIDVALDHLREIVRERMANHQTVSSVDVTFKKNIPVKP